MTNFKNFPGPISAKSFIEGVEYKKMRLSYLMDNYLSIGFKNGRFCFVLLIKSKSDALLVSELTGMNISKTKNSYKFHFRRERLFRILEKISDYSIFVKQKIQSIGDYIYLPPSKCKESTEEILKKIKSNQVNCDINNVNKEYLFQFLLEPTNIKIGIYKENVFVSFNITTQNLFFREMLVRSLSYFGINYVIRKGNSINANRYDLISILNAAILYKNEEFHILVKKILESEEDKHTIFSKIREIKNESPDPSICNFVSNEQRKQEKLDRIQAEKEEKEVRLRQKQEIEAEEERLRQIEIEKRKELRRAEQKEKKAAKLLELERIRERKRNEKIEKVKRQAELWEKEQRENLRVCKCCGAEKPLELYGSSKTTRGGKKYICKKCSYEKYVDKDEARTKTLKWMKENPEKTLESRKRTRQRPEVKIRRILKSRLKRYFEWPEDTTATFRQILGCTPKELKMHLESQFQEGMNWENYGEVWHIDHVVPCAAFNHQDPKHVSICWSYKNYKPEFSDKNLRKSDVLKNGISARIMKRENPDGLKQIVNESLRILGLENAY